MIRQFLDHFLVSGQITVLNITLRSNHSQHETPQGHLDGQVDGALLVAHAQGGHAREAQRRVGALVVGRHVERLAVAVREGDLGGGAVHAQHAVLAVRVRRVGFVVVDAHFETCNRLMHTFGACGWRKMVSFSHSYSRLSITN